QGRDATGLPPYELYGMGMARTFQIPALFWKLTVLENLLVAEKNNPGERFLKSILPIGFSSFKELLTPMWAEAETRAIEKASRILKLRDEMGITFFIVEHRLDIALKYVDNMFAMALGRVVASGTPDDVMNDKRVIDAYLGG